MKWTIYKVKRTYRKLRATIGTKLFGKQIALEREAIWLSIKLANLRTKVNVLRIRTQYPRPADNIEAMKKRLDFLGPKLDKWEIRYAELQEELKKYPNRKITFADIADFMDRYK